VLIAAREKPKVHSTQKIPSKRQILNAPLSDGEREPLMYGLNPKTITL